MTRPYSDPIQHDREEAEIRIAAWRARDRVTPPQEHKPVNVEPPSIHYRIVLKRLIDFKQEMQTIQRDIRYPSGTRELCRQAVVVVGPLIGEAMREKRRHDEQCEAGNREARERWDKFLKNWVAMGRRLESFLDGGSPNA